MYQLLDTYETNDTNFPPAVQDRRGLRNLGTTAQRASHQTAQSARAALRPLLFATSHPSHPSVLPRASSAPPPHQPLRPPATPRARLSDPWHVLGSTWSPSELPRGPRRFAGSATATADWMESPIRRTPHERTPNDSPRAWSPNVEHLSTGRLSTPYSQSLEFLSSSSLTPAPPLRPAGSARAASFSQPASFSQAWSGSDPFEPPAFDFRNMVPAAGAPDDPALHTVRPSVAQAFGSSTMLTSSDADPQDFQPEFAHEFPPQQYPPRQYHPDTDHEPGSPHVLDAFTVLAPDGGPVHLSRIAAAARTLCVLIFVPRDSVELAGLVYGKVAHLLQQAGCRLVFVTAWAPGQAATFLSRFERVSPFPGALVCDPGGGLFAHFGFTRTKLAALLSGTSRLAGPRHGMRNALAAAAYRARNRDLATTRTPSSRLRCGAVVLRSPSPSAFSPDGTPDSSFGSIVTPDVVYHGLEGAGSGAACHIDVLAACRVHGAFVPNIDPAQLYKRFNNMRVTSQKARQQDEKEARMKQKNDPMPSRPRVWY